MKSILRAIWGFIAFIPFCYLWGVNNFTLFAVVGTLYFVPVHWLFDRLMTTSLGCVFGIHDWHIITNRPYDTTRQCEICGRKERKGFDGLVFNWSEIND